MISKEDIERALQIVDDGTDITPSEETFALAEIIHPMWTVLCGYRKAAEILAAAWRSLDGSFVVIQPNQAGPALRIEFSLPKSAAQEVVNKE